MEESDVTPATYKKRLEQAGLKATHQRLITLRALEEYDGHPTAEMLYNLLKVEHPTISLGTVYRTLEIFNAHGLARKASNPDGRLLFDGCTDTHHHLYSRSERTLTDFHDPQLNDLIREALANHPIARKFQIDDFQLQVIGEFIQNENV